MSLNRHGRRCIPRPPRVRTPRSRTAFTLIEMVLVLGLASTVMTLVGVTLHRVYRVDRQIREEIRLIGIWAELGTRFRADAHAAMDVTSDASATTLSTDESTTIEYSVTADAVARIVRKGDAVRHRETYRLPRGFAARIANDETISPPRVGLVVTRRAADSPSVVFRIEATVGLSR